MKPPPSVHCVTPRVLLNTPAESRCGYRVRVRVSIVAAWLRLIHSIKRRVRAEVQCTPWALTNGLHVIHTVYANKMFSM